MADFFNTASQADLNLLHSSVRDSNELDNVIDSVEWEIIDAFTQRQALGRSTIDAFFEFEAGSDPSSEPEVRLVGYDADTPAESESGLKEALRRTIADVASWVLRNYNVDQKAQSVRQGRRSITFSGSSPSWQDWPDGWDRKLNNYDARIKTWGI